MKTYAQSTNMFSANANHASASSHVLVNLVATVLRAVAIFVLSVIRVIRGLLLGLIRLISIVIMNTTEYEGQPVLQSC